MNSCFTLSLVTGQSVTDLTQNAVANLGWDEVRLPHPLFEGDTVYSRSEVLEARESKSRPNVGIVRVKTTGVNQHGTASSSSNGRSWCGSGDMCRETPRRTRRRERSALFDRSRYD